MPYLKTTDQINWFYETFGTGTEKILFLHGWGVDRRIWRQQYKYFADHYQVMILDLPGHGNSSFHRISLWEMAHDIREVLIHAGFSQFNFVGSSLGGLVGMKMYELYPKTFQKMTFVGSSPKFATSEDYPYGIDVKKLRKLGGQLESHYPNIVDIFFRSLFTKEERESRRFKWLTIFRRGDKEQTPLKPALAEYLDILEHEDLRHVLPKVSVPMQFINGTGDEICTMDNVNYIRSIVPSARYDEFDKCGHFPFLTQPHAFNRVLEDFLKWSL